MLRRHREKLNELGNKLVDRTRQKIRRLHDRLQRAILRWGERHPKHQTKLFSQRLDQLEKGLGKAILSDLRGRQSQLKGLEGQLRALGPENVLARGYSITSLKKTGAVIRSEDQLKVGDRIVTRFANGSAESTVADARQLPLFE